MRNVNYKAVYATQDYRLCTQISDLLVYNIDLSHL